MPLTTINNTELFVEDTCGDGPAVVFTHALFFSGAMYDQQIAALSDTYRCITVAWGAVRNPWAAMMWTTLPTM